MLKITQLDTGYGRKQAVFGLSLDVREGEIVALIGPNGAGKSTVLKAVCGLIPAWTGKIHFNGSPINGASPAQNVARGISFLPQGNRVFSDLTIMENLEIGGNLLSRREAKQRIAQIVEMFPVLKERSRQKAGKLSGGEQQMLALARGLIPKPKLLMLDEPSLGLAPGLVRSVLNRVAEINRETKVSILIVEQKVRDVLSICNRVYSMKLGRLAFQGLPDELKTDTAKLRDLFL